MKRFAILYSDGSFNVSCPESIDLETAKKRLCMSNEDQDTKLVEVEIKITKDHGFKPRIVDDGEEDERALYQKLKEKYEHEER